MISLVLFRATRVKILTNANEDAKKEACQSGLIDPKIKIAQHYNYALVVYLL